MVISSDSRSLGQGKDDICIHVPLEFNFLRCLQFLNRNTSECLHEIENQRWRKLLVLDNRLVLLQVGMISGKLKISPMNTSITSTERKKAIEYVKELFDLSCDMRPFYDQMEYDPVMGSIVKALYGLRLIGIPELFEALCWCIIGQQINLNFAYSLKRRLVMARGEKLQYEGKDYYMFPEPEVVAAMSADEFSGWQYSASKARYLINTAKEISAGKFSKESLLNMSDEEVLNRLTELPGIGPWSANYVMMKCLRIRSAYPSADVGLQNAIKAQLKLSEKPSNSMMEQFGLKWQPWQAYATFYLWHTLIK